MQQEMNARKRILMIKELENQGIKDKKVLEAMEKIERHEFVPREVEAEAYINTPLPIGYEQTISQPYTVAYMLELLELEKGNKVLEIGTGSGYNASLIGEIVGSKGKVYSVEIIPELAKFSKENIRKTGLKNVEIIIGDGGRGYEKGKPYDRIIITAATKEIQPALLKQLREGGILIAPLGERDMQTMTKIKKTKNGIVKKEFGGFLFVPLTGKYKAKNI